MAFYRQSVSVYIIGRERRKFPRSGATDLSSRASSRNRDRKAIIFGPLKNVNFHIPLKRYILTEPESQD